MATLMTTISSSSFLMPAGKAMSGTLWLRESHRIYD